MESLKFIEDNFGGEENVYHAKTAFQTFMTIINTDHVYSKAMDRWCYVYGKITEDDIKEYEKKEINIPKIKCQKFNVRGGKKE